MLGKTEILGWIRSFFDDEPARGEGAPSKALVPPGSPATISAGCNANPCFVCVLRKTIERTLLRDQRLEGALRRDAEAREKKAKKQASGAKGAIASAMPERPLGTQPLELQLIGMRREGSLSDEFDDRMLVVTRLPDVETGEHVKGAVEPELLEALRRAAEAAPQAVKVVSCSGGAWLVGMFSISTDPGLAARREDVRASLALLEEQLEENRTALDGARRRKQQLDEVDVAEAKRALDEAKKELDSAEEALGEAKKQLEEALAKSRKLRPELTSLQATATSRRTGVQGAREKVGKATREYGAKTRAATEAERLVKKYEGAGPKLEKQRTDRKAAFEAALAARAKSSIGLKDGNEGWLAEGRAMMLPGHYRAKFRYFIHLTSAAKAFSKNTSLTALVPDTELHGLRAYSGRHIRANAGSFKTGELVGEVRRPKDPPTRFFADEGTLIVTVAAGRVAAISVRDAGSGRETALDDDDVVLLRRSVAGTNVHRAHNAPGLPGADGRLHGPARPTQWVSVWSEGCQVFPSSDDFNLFISLCATAKRWRCVSEKKDCAGECKVLEVGAGEGLGAGEQALVTRFKRDFLDSAADSYGRSKDPVIEKKITRIDELTWNDEDRAKLAGLMRKKADAMAKGKSLGGRDADDLADVEAKRSRKLSDAESLELKRLESDREKWRRDYLREKARRLAADHLRVCDVLEKCHQRFSYTLVETSSAEMDAVDAAFKEARNKGWNGKLA